MYQTTEQIEAREIITRKMSDLLSDPRTADNMRVSFGEDGRILVYPRMAGTGNGQKPKDAGRPAVNDLSVHGMYIDNRAARRIKCACYYMIRKHMGRQIRFITLTLGSAKQKDKDGKEIFAEHKFYIQALSKFLENLKKNYGLKDYVWVAEIQDGKRRNDNGSGRGAIHFHILGKMRFKDNLPLRLSGYWSKLVYDYHEPSVSCVDLITMKTPKKIDEYLGKTRWLDGGKLAKYLEKTKNLKKDPDALKKVPDLRIYGRAWGMDQTTGRNSEDKVFPAWMVRDKIKDREFQEVVIVSEDGEIITTMYKLVDSSLCKSLSSWCDSQTRPLLFDT